MQINSGSLSGQARVTLEAFQAKALENAQAKAGSADAEGQKEVSEGFEEMLARMLVSELRKSVPEGMFGGGAGSDVYASWFDEHVSRVLAEQRAFGIGELVETSLGDITPDELAARDAEETE